ncbi:tetratricopeptide repeat protein [Pseudonocardia saturnea]
MSADEPDGLLDALRRVLVLQQEDAPDPARAALLRELSDRPPIIAAIERSSLAGAPDDDTSAADVVRILRRASAIAQEGAGPEETAVDDPVTHWVDELRRLLLTSVRTVTNVAAELHGLGFALRADELETALFERPVCPDRELLRSVVTLLGGDWAGGGYEALHDAALDHEVGRLFAAEQPRVPSGLSGAEQLTERTLVAQVRPPVETLPETVHGRDDVLGELLPLLDAPTTTTQVLTGKGGSGKSTVALTVADEAQRRGHHVWWVSASDPNQVTRGMMAVATELGAPLSELNAIQSDAPVGVELLWRRLQAAGRRWLLVFDDADDPAVLRIPAAGTRWFRPSDVGTVMIASRVVDETAWGPDARLTEIEDLPSESGAEVILDRIRRPGRHADDDALRAHARDLSAQLGGVPLALRNVGDYLGSGVARQTIAELVRSLDARRLADTHVDSADPRGRIATTWELSLSALAGKDLAEARTLLRLLACYAPGKWAVTLDVIAPDRLHATGLSTGRDSSPARWRAALDGLCAVGLIGRTITAGHRIEGVVVHPLVAEVSLDSDDDGVDVAAVEAAAVDLLWQAVKDLDAAAPRNWPVLRRLEPHVYAVIDAVRTKRAQEDTLRLADRTAEGLVRAGLHALGEELIRHARALTPLGPEHPRVLATEHTLAWAVGLRGELAEAERRLSALVADRTRISGPTHEATLLARDHLAWVLAEQGRLEEADRSLRELLAVRAGIDGTSTVHALAIRHRIAWVAALRGQLAEAEGMFRAVLPRRHALLGPEHMEVFSTRYRLAWSVAIQGRAEEAEALFSELSADLERVLAPGSAPVTLVRARLGHVRAILGRFEQAERDHRQVLDARRRLLGPDHPRTVRARHDLAWMLALKGDLRGAERGYREVLADCDGNPRLGKDHPLTLEARGRLARLLTDTGRLDEACRRLRALIPDRRRVSGPDHPVTLIVRQNLGLVLLARGRYREAQTQLELVLDDQLRVLGPEHRHVLATRTALAKLVGRLGDLAAAGDRIDRVRALSDATLGPDHPDSLAVRQVQVWVLGEQERLGEATAECRALLADRTRVLGPEHLDTLDTRYRLGWLHGLAGRGAMAEQVYRELLVSQQQSLGRDHPHTLRSRHGLANELLRAGRTAEAERELRRVLLDRTRTLGRRHPDTLSNRHSLAFARALGGKTEEAEESLQELLVDQSRLLGADHRDTLGTRERLAWLRERSGRLDRAAGHWHALLRDRERVLGPDHPDTRRAAERVASWTHEVDRIW